MIPHLAAGGVARGSVNSVHHLPDQGATTTGNLSEAIFPRLVLKVWQLRVLSRDIPLIALWWGLRCVLRIASEMPFSIDHNFRGAV